MFPIMIFVHFDDSSWSGQPPHFGVALDFGEGFKWQILQTQMLSVSFNNKNAYSSVR